MQYPTPIEIEQSLQRFADWRYCRITGGFNRSTQHLLILMRTYGSYTDDVSLPIFLRLTMC